MGGYCGRCGTDCGTGAACVVRAVVLCEKACIKVRRDKYLRTLKKIYK